MLFGNLVWLVAGTASVHFSGREVALDAVQVWRAGIAGQMGSGTNTGFRTVALQTGVLLVAGLATFAVYPSYRPMSPVLKK